MRTNVRREGEVNPLGLASLFAGKMLGDGYMNRTHRAPRFSFIHSSSDRAYAHFCYNLFCQYLPYGPSGIWEESIFDRRTQKTYNRIICQSRSCVFLEELYPLWYRGRKVVPMEWVAINLDLEGLAIWFQDDGSLKQGGQRIILSTETFAPEEGCFFSPC